MYWFLISPVNGLNSWPDDEKGKDKVIEQVAYEIAYYKDQGYKPKDFLIFRGEQHAYFPPSSKTELIKLR